MSLLTQKLPLAATDTMIPTAAYRELLRQDFFTFLERSFYELNPPPLVYSRHLEVIANALEDCRLGKIRRLVINLPPRGLKSHCASIAFPAWILGHNPSAHLVFASYGQELAEKFARETKKLMNSAFYKALFRTRFAARNAVHDFETTDGGTRVATSVGGPLTGRGADFIVIDDAMKPDEAISDTRRKAVNDWFDGTVLSRLNNKKTGCIIIIMQRLHHDDLVAHALERDDSWVHLSFPAIAEEHETYEIRNLLGKTQFNRAPGDALQPEWEPLAELENIRERMGKYNFAGQYQQRPTPMEGAIIKEEWLQYYDVRPDIPGRIVQSWDTANKAEQLHDYSVCTTWLVIKKNYYLLDVLRARLDYPQLKQALIDQKLRFKPHLILIEDRASGTQLIQELRQQQLPIRGYLPPKNTDKTMRLFTQSIRFETGSVFLPRQASWLTEYRNEITRFPASKYDDQVDSTTQFLDGGTTSFFPISDELVRTLSSSTRRRTPCFF
jgi:predicted phage terminase large subunit-like protein